MKLKVTSDGSHTILSSIFNVHYHSVHGALTESRYVFIQSGIQEYVHRHPSSEIIRIFELGFGTGLNALLAHDFTLPTAYKLRYTGIELFPLKEIDDLNYTDNPTLAQYEDFFTKLHGGAWNESLSIENSEFIKMNGDFLLNEFSQEYDLIFYDAFGSNTQVELWTYGALLKCYNMLSENGIWVSYCAKGQVRRNLQDIGFKVERIPGPPGKREMLRATK